MTLQRCKHGLVMGASIAACAPCLKQLQEVRREIPVFEAEQDAEREALIVGLYLLPSSTASG